MEAIRPEVAVRMPEAQFEREIAALVADIALQKKLALSGPEQAQVCRRIVAEMIGFGPIEPLLADETVSDILVNGPRQVYIERHGKLELTDVTFGDDQHVLNVAARIVNRAGRRIDESTPLVDARLPDGSRINVIIPPLAVRGPMMSIRKFAKREITLDILAQQQSMSPAMAGRHSSSIPGTKAVRRFFNRGQRVGRPAPWRRRALATAAWPPSPISTGSTGRKFAGVVGINSWRSAVACDGGLLFVHHPVVQDAIPRPFALRRPQS